MENVELYIIAALFLIILWLIVDTIKYYHGEKRKVKHLHRFANEGEADAQSKLAKRYQKGNIVKKDCEKAAFWYQQASFSGDEEAKVTIKKFFEKGKKPIKKKKC